MSAVIAVVNQKGGVGKTTVTLNLGVSLASLLREVLLIDLDPQANLSSGLSNLHTLSSRGAASGVLYDVSDLLLDPSLVFSTVYPTTVDFVDLSPSSENLVGIELLLKDLEAREARLKKALDRFNSMYQFIFIDCPPSLGLLTINALCAADYVLIPMTAEYYALEGLSTLVRAIQRIQETQNTDLKVLGIVFTMHDPRLQLSQAVIQEVRSHFPEQIFDTIIPRNVRIAEAPSFSLPVELYAPRSSGTQAFAELGKEFLSKISNFKFQI